MIICCLSFFLSWTCWDRIFSHTLCKSKAHCHWPASTYTVFCWSAKSLWILFLFGLWIRIMYKGDKKPLKDAILVFGGKRISNKESLWLLNDAGALLLVFFSSWVFISPYPEYSRKIISAVLTNSGILIIEPKIFLFWLIFSVFPLRFWWLHLWSSEYCYFLPCCFLPKFLMFPACSELHTTSAYPCLSHLECSYLTHYCCWVCDNFMPLVQLTKLNLVFNKSGMRLWWSVWAFQTVLS